MANLYTDDKFEESSSYHPSTGLSSSDSDEVFNLFVVDRPSSAKRKRNLPVGDKFRAEGRQTEKRLSRTLPATLPCDDNEPAAISCSTPIGTRPNGKSSQKQGSGNTEVMKYLMKLEKKIDSLSKVQTEINMRLKHIEQFNESSKNARKKSMKIDVPSHIRAAVHDGYKSGVHEQNMKWTTKDTDRLLKSSSEENKAMTKFIIAFVKGLYPQTEDGVIKAGVERYFETVKQKDQKERTGKGEAHKKKMLNYSRRQRKLAWRQAALHAKQGWNETKKEKIASSLDIQFMSSEEEVNSGDELFFRVKPISWRSLEYNKICQELDAKHERTKSSRSRRQMVKRVKGTTPSSRPKPNNIDPKHCWVVANDAVATELMD